MNGLDRILSPLKRRVGLMVGRAVIKLIDDSAGLQLAQVTLLADELRAQVERFQNYGMTSVPLPGAEGAAICVGGSRDHILLVAVDDRRYRLKGLEGGEVALYTDEGDTIVLKRGNVIQVTSATKVLIDAPLVEATHNLKVGGNLEVDGTTLLVGATHVEASLQVDGTVTATSVDASTSLTVDSRPFMGHEHTGGTISGHTGPVV